MSDTPRTDEAMRADQRELTGIHLRDCSRQLERELAAAQERVRRLEEAGDEMAKDHNPFTFLDWNKSKEAKP